MKIASLLLCVGLVITGSMVFGATPSKTTEFHSLATSITADKTMNIILPDGVLVTGLVKNSSGQPVKGAFVSAELIQGQVAAVGSMTDATGKFNIPVQPGTYNFFVTPPRSASLAPGQFSRLLRAELANVSVTGAATIGPITLPNGFILSGAVTSPSGAMSLFSGILWSFPVPGGTLGFQPAQFGAPPSGSTQYATALAAGSYKSVLIPILAYSQTFQQLSVAFSTAQFTINADKTMNMKLRNGHLLSGTVHDTAGKNVPGLVWVYQKTAYEQGVYVGFGFTVNGTYQTYLPPGNYIAVFVPVASSSYTGRGATTSMAFTMTTTSKTLNLTSPNGVILSGKVTSAHNTLVKGSGVMLRGTGNQPWGPNQITFAAFAATTATGQYRLVVPAGTYDVVGFPAATTVKTSSPEAAAMMEVADRIGH